MAYATSEELRDRMGPSVFEELYAHPDLALPDLESAAAEIDGAIALRYALPVSGARTLALLKDWNLTLAEERAAARPAGASFGEKITRRVDQVRSYLQLLRDDRFRLPDAVENGTSGSAGGGVSLVQCDPPVFGRGKMSGF